MKKLTFLLLITMFVMFFSGCVKESGYPSDIIGTGDVPMVVYKMEKVTGDNVKFGKYVYAINDATSKGWTLYSNVRLSLGDTVYITNKK